MVLQGEVPVYDHGVSKQVVCMSDYECSFKCVYTWEPSGTPKPDIFPSFGVDTVFSVITGLLVRLKARSDGPKYGLLMHVMSKKNIGFFLGVYQYGLAFSSELPG